REEDVDARADLFALGCILYETLTAVRPLEGQSPLETFDRAKRGQFAPIREVKADVPDELAEIVARAMASERGERYPNAGELYEDLIQFLYASGRRVGAHDLSRFLDGVSSAATEGPEPLTESGIEEVFAELSNT